MAERPALVPYDQSFWSYQSSSTTNKHAYQSNNIRYRGFLKHEMVLHPNPDVGYPEYPVPT